jgi:hypothetical protein
MADGKEQAHPVGPTDVQVFSHDFLEEVATLDRLVEDLSLPPPTCVSGAHILSRDGDSVCGAKILLNALPELG